MTSEDVENRPPGDALGALRTLADDLARSSRSENTQRSYRSAWRGFVEWTKTVGVEALPALPETVSLYVAHLVTLGRRMATVQRAVVAISQKHLDAGLPTPRQDARVRRVLRGAGRQIGTEQHAKVALTPEQVRAMIDALGTDLRARRNRAILALGFASGLRRSELVALDVADLEWRGDGLVVNVRHAKRALAPRRVRLRGFWSPSWALEEVRRWVEAAGLGQGPLFTVVTPRGEVGSRRLQERAVLRLVQAIGVRVGLDPKTLGAHSLRSGFATAAARAGTLAPDIQRALGHASAAMTARYVQAAATED